MAIEAGYSLQLCGAETYRVEDSCLHLLHAYHCETAEIFAVANFLSIAFRDAEGNYYTEQKRVYQRSDNLGKIDLLNRKIREICASEAYDPVKARSDIQEIMQLPPYSFAAQCLITGLCGFGFTLLIGGSLWAGIYAFMIDVLLRLLLEPLYKQHANKIFVNIIGGIIVSFLAWPCKYLALYHEMNLIVSGSFMYLFPGIALMNSVRDIIASDYLAGMSKLLETILAAISIAIGSGIAFSILRVLGA